jgi:hypothetical protein
VGVVECCCEAEERDYGSDFVQDEEGCDMCQGSRAEGIGIFMQELGEAAIEALDARLRGWRSSGLGGIAS